MTKSLNVPGKPKMHPPRALRRTVRRSEVPREARELLEGLFISELLRPSRVVWLVSAWISDVGIIDNRVGAYSDLEPAWPRSYVYLSRVLVALAGRGTTVRVATNHKDHNQEFCDRLHAVAAEGLPLIVRRSEDLHDKGLLTDRFFLHGSMNFTNSGILAEDRSELIDLICDPARVAEERVSFAERWGGVLS